MNETFPNKNATIIEDLEQGSIEWLKTRQQHITATDVAAILGKSPWNTPLTLYTAKKQENPTPASSPWMKAGHMYEDALLNHAAEHFGMTDLVHGRVLEDGWKLASLDGDALLNGERVIVEAKTSTNPSHWFAKDGSEIVPEYYRLQVQYQMLVSGVGTTIFTVGNLDGKTFGDYGEWFSRTVHADLELQAYIENECEKFFNLLQSNTPPSPQLSPYDEWVGKAETEILKDKVGTEDTEAELSPTAVTQYQFLKQQEKILKAQIQGQYNYLLEQMGTAKYGTIEGHRVAEWVNNFGRQYLKVKK